jgi:hypothetical protein
VLFQDEKGPIAAKIYGGTSYGVFYTQAKVEHTQKIKGILMNVFGIYDLYINDRGCLPIATKRRRTAKNS